jgi:hypothetical protein
MAKEALARPPAPPGAASGLFRAHHFQVAYATNDLDKASALFAERFGVKRFQPLDGPLPEGGRYDIRLGWAGGTMYELAWAEGPGGEVFMGGLPTDRFAIRHHHLGYHIPTLEAWEALQAEIKALGYKTVLSNDVPGFLKACIIEVPELGHCAEYIYSEPAGIEFFEGCPGN